MSRQPLPAAVSINEASKYARLAGLLLLGALGSSAAGLRNFTSYDARAEYFAPYIPSLIGQRAEHAVALAAFALTGVLIMLTGILLTLAFSRSGAAHPIPGIVLAVSGAGFLLAAALGLVAVGILNTAAELQGVERLTHAATAFPWASGSQTTLLMLGLGVLALALFLLLVTMLRAGAFSLRLIVVAVALPVVAWIGIALVGEAAPLVWLVAMLPIVMWSVGLGIFLTITGRVTAGDAIPSA